MRGVEILRFYNLDCVFCHLSSHHPPGRGVGGQAPFLRGKPLVCEREEKKKRAHASLATPLPFPWAPPLLLLFPPFSTFLSLLLLFSFLHLFPFSSSPSLFLLFLFSSLHLFPFSFLSFSWCRTSQNCA